MSRSISQRTVLRVLIPLICTLLVLNVLTIIFNLYLKDHHASITFFIDMFNFDKEKNIPTLYSVLALLYSSYLLAYIAKKTSGAVWVIIGWSGLSFIFFFLAGDEAFRIHEKYGREIRAAYDTKGIFYFAWVIPYGLALLAFIAIYTKFLLYLPKKTMVLFVVSGGIFVGGALGIELFGSARYEKYGPQDLVYSMMYSAEEFLEMLGIVLFIYTLKGYIADQKQTALSK